MDETNTNTAEKTPFEYDGIVLKDLTIAEANALEPRRRMEILNALNSHVIAHGGKDVISPEEERGALYLISAQRAQAVASNPRASKAAKDTAQAAQISLSDFD